MGLKVRIEAHHPPPFIRSAKQLKAPLFLKITCDSNARMNYENPSEFGSSDITLH